MSRLTFSGPGCDNSRSMKWLPMKPQPPVTNTRTMNVSLPQTAEQLGPALARGGSAEIFGLGPHILKLYVAEGSLARAEREARQARAALAAGLPAPEVHDVVTIGSRSGIVFERISGPTLYERCRAEPDQIAAIAGRFAEL